MQNSQSLCSPTNLLLCRENVGSLDEEDDEMGEFASVLEDGFDDEYINILLDKEITNAGLQMQDFPQNSWMLRARLDGIQYILRTREVLGFRFQTAYASISYLDRFLSRRSIDGEKSWAIRLLSMGCLSLAAKMEESVVPQLSEFCLEDYNFESSVIQRMELLVLNALEWKMGSITPFYFIKFFANKFFDGSLPRNGVSRIVEVILATIRDVKIMCNKASVIAAAATLVVMYQDLTRDKLQLKLGPLISNPCLKTEDIISCYCLLQEMEIERMKLSKGIKTPDLSPMRLLRAETYGSSSVTSAASAKRKRLIFNQDEEQLAREEGKKALKTGKKGG
ncbi:G1/S-specific cyclin D [Handroanthus impetiginosus]|uniref:G1/S-specific cyclin D n=1 Tax=Handroanthus impetiginosus TaxID=429701 RepID=A0A2G9HTA3_9LAMI|nr:G1/S-specific cyclin D [Handroanthus impetiginosus]